MHDTASRCPDSARANGFAKTLSSLVALSARVYSRARSKGCSAGSGFLKTLTTSVFRSRVKSSSFRERTCGGTAAYGFTGREKNIRQTRSCNGTLK